MTDPFTRIDGSPVPTIADQLSSTRHNFEIHRDAYNRLKIANHALQVAHNKSVRALAAKTKLAHDLSMEVISLRERIRLLGGPATLSALVDFERQTPTHVPPKRERRQLAESPSA